MASITQPMTNAAIRSQLDRGDIIAEHVVVDMLSRLQAFLMQEDNVVRVQSPVIICGDVHGKYEDVNALFAAAEASPVDTNFIFMGDYVDRGHYSLNTFLLLTSYKLDNPNHIFLLRGNHESRQVTHQYGFFAEITTLYGHAGVWNVCMRTFDLLPYAAVTDSEVFSVHGGLSPNLNVIDNLLEFDRGREIPDSGLLSDITWSDPDEGRGLTFVPNRRGAGFLFGKEPVTRFCHVNKIKLVTRSHQICMDGFKWHFPDESNNTFQGQLINVWSAPNYCYTSKNKASVLKLGFNGKRWELPVFLEAKDRIDKDGRVVAPDYFA
jgi:diadenosine tetraphosphatase ApaH/serine/threonine PP2A family protein phosphatase